MDDQQHETMGGIKRPHEEDAAGGDEDDLSDNEHQTSKSRGTVTVQIFIKKTYKMINDCDPKIATWTPEGDKFVIKDPEMFAQQVIPQYFDHNKFSSFTRQLNFYKFTREQSKAIKKSDNSSEIAKHQTFYHKYFQRGRPDLLKHLQRSRKTQVHDDDMHPHSQGAKKPKMATSGGQHIDEKSILEQISDLVRRTTEAELTIRNLQQENATLSFAVQKLQKQDEMKQRALVALQEQIRMSEVNMSQSLQQQQSQLLQFTQPLPYSREPSLSGVNTSALMRFLSIDPKLQRLTTPPFGNLTASSQGAAFSAAAAAENLVQQATENAAAAARNPLMKGGSAEALAGVAGAPTGAGPGATLPRHARFKSSVETTAAAVAAAGMDSGASLPRHANFKSSSEAAAAAGGGAGMGSGAALPRHPKMRRSADAGAPGPAGGMAMMAQNGFMDTKAGSLEDAMRNGQDEKAGGNEKSEALAMLANNSSRTGTISPSPTPSALAQNGFGGGVAQLPGNLGASIQNSMTAASLRAAMPGGLGQGADFSNLAKDPSMQLRLGAAGLPLERELSNIGGDGVTREESFTLASLLDLSRGPTQPI